MNYESYQEFIKPDDIPMFFIIWNLYLTDKESIITREDIIKNKINTIILIMPKNKLKYKYIDTFQDLVEFIHLPYEYQNPTNKNDYEPICNKLIQLQSIRKNALIICNNGYQRSIPFLCYYLTKYHSDEITNIEQALKTIISQVSPQDYNNINEITKNTIEILS